MNRLRLVSSLLFLAGVACAQDAPTGPGPFAFEQVVVDGVISGNPGADQTIRVTADAELPNGLRLVQKRAARNHPLHFRATNADGADGRRVWKMGGPLSVDAHDVTHDFGGGGGLDLDFGTKPAVITCVDGTSINLNGSIVRAAGLTKGGSGGRFSLNGQAMPGLAGPVRVEGGWLTLRGETTLPAITSLYLGGQSVLKIDDQDTNRPDRIPDALPIVTGGGTMILLSGADRGAVSETLGTVQVAEGGLGLYAATRGEGSASLTITGLARAPGTVLLVGGEQVGGKAQVLVRDDAALLKDAVGGGGGPGTTTASVIPWARVARVDNLTQAQGFLAYSHDQGFRALRLDSEYAQGLDAAKPADNVRLSADRTVMAKATTVNALFCEPAIERALIDLGGKTLTVASGALGTSRQVVVREGVLTTGNQRPLIFTGNEFHMQARLAGTGGLVLFSDASVGLINPGTTLSGDYVIARGSLSTSDGEMIPDGVTVRLHREGTLRIGGMESIRAITGTGAVRLGHAGRSLLMIGSCVGSAHQITLGQGGEVRPGDTSATPGIGTLRMWVDGDDDRPGRLIVRGGTVAIDVAADGHDQVLLASKDKAVFVNGGTLRVNRMAGCAPKVGTSWDILVGTAAASGRGFDSIVDAGGKGYAYKAEATENRWVLTVTAAP